VRQAILVHGSSYENDTIPESWDDYIAGQHLVLNDTETREFHLVMNGKDKDYPEQRKEYNLEGIRCVGSCVEEIEEYETESEYRFWSDVSNWPDGVLPAEGEDVHVLSGWNMILDIEETPIFKMVRINGKLTFGNETYLTPTYSTDLTVCGENPNCCCGCDVADVVDSI